MKSYYRIMLGRKSVHSKDAFAHNYIGAGWLPEQNLENKIPENWRDFNKKYIPIYLKTVPGKSKVSAGLACGMLHTIVSGIKIGDVVLCPDGLGSYHAGEVVGGYEYVKGESLPHRRSVKWFSRPIARSEMSDGLRNSSGSIGTVSDVSKYGQEIETLISGVGSLALVARDESVESPTVFALEQHLEDFLEKNWRNTELGKRYDIYEEDGEKVGRQYPSDTGPIDILAISKDKKELLVVELKKGRASDVVVGQVQRYMGYVKDELAEKNQKVCGVIIAFEDDTRIQRALSVTSGIDFYTYEVSFKLKKVR